MALPRLEKDGARDADQHPVALAPNLNDSASSFSRELRLHVFFELYLEANPILEAQELLLHGDEVFLKFTDPRAGVFISALEAPGFLGALGLL